MRGLRGLSHLSSVLLPLQMGTRRQEHRFASKQMAGHLLKDCQGYRQDGFPAPRVSSRQGQRSWVSGLGRTESFIAIQGPMGTGGFFVRGDLRYFHLGKGFAGS